MRRFLVGDSNCLQGIRRLLGPTRLSRAGQAAAALAAGCCGPATAGEVVPPPKLLLGLDPGRARPSCSLMLRIKVLHAALLRCSAPHRRVRPRGATVIDGCSCGACKFGVVQSGQCHGTSARTQLLPPYVHLTLQVYMCQQSGYSPHQGPYDGHTSLRAFVLFMLQFATHLQLIDPGSLPAIAVACISHVLLGDCLRKPGVFLGVNRFFGCFVEYTPRPNCQPRNRATETGHMHMNLLG